MKSHLGRNSPPAAHIPPLRAQPPVLAACATRPDSFIRAHLVLAGGGRMVGHSLVYARCCVITVVWTILLSVIDQAHLARFTHRENRNPYDRP
jgi:hypothetical protein